MAIFEGYERRIDKINAELAKYGINGIDEAKAICDAKGIDVFSIVRGIQMIAFDNACWAYAVGAATVTEQAAVLPLSDTARMFVFPGATAVTTPFSSTVATLSSADFQP